MRHKLLRIAPTVGGILASGIFSVAHAFTAVYPSGLTKSLPTTIANATDVTTLICTIVVWFFWGLIVLSIVMFLIGGYRYATSGGDSEKVRTANKTLLYAAIAVAVALVAAGVPYIVNSFLGGGAFAAAC